MKYMRIEHMDRKTLETFLHLAKTRKTSGVDSASVIKYITFAASLPIVSRLKQKSSTTSKRPHIPKSDQQDLKNIAKKCITTSRVQDFHRLPRATHEELAQIFTASLVAQYGDREQKRLYSLRQNTFALAIAACDPVKVYRALQDVKTKDLLQTAKTFRAAVGEHKWFPSLQSRAAIIDSLVRIVVKLKVDLGEELRNVRGVRKAIDSVIASDVNTPLANLFAGLLDDRFCKGGTLTGGDKFWTGKVCIYFFVQVALRMATITLHWLFWIPYVIWVVAGYIYLMYDHIQDQFKQEEHQRQNKRFSAMSNEEPKYRKLLGLGNVYSDVDIVHAHRHKALQAHPDRGGSHEEMVALNEAKDNLIALNKARSWWQRMPTFFSKSSKKAISM